MNEVCRIPPIQQIYLKLVIIRGNNEKNEE